jgi:hypothetical protein
MMQPLPTPYDITPLPAFAYAPGLSDWLLVVGLLSVLCVLVFVVSRFRGKRRSLDPFAVAISELGSLSANRGMKPKEALARASLLVKRLGEHLNAGPLPHMTPRELHTFVAQGTSPELIALINEAAAIDDLRFAPEILPEEVQTRLRRLENLVCTLRGVTSGGAA